MYTVYNCIELQRERRCWRIVETVCKCAIVSAFLSTCVLTSNFPCNQGTVGAWFKVYPPRLNAFRGWFKVYPPRNATKQQCAVPDAFAQLARAWSVIWAGCRVRSRPLDDAVCGHGQFNALLPTHRVPLLGDLQCTCYSVHLVSRARVVHCPLHGTTVLTDPPTHLARFATLANTQYTLPCLRTNYCVHATCTCCMIPSRGLLGPASCGHRTRNASETTLVLR